MRRRGIGEARVIDAWKAGQDLSLNAGVASDHDDRIESEHAVHPAKGAHSRQQQLLRAKANINRLGWDVPQPPQLVRHASPQRSLDFKLWQAREALGMGQSPVRGTSFTFRPGALADRARSLRETRDELMGANTIERRDGDVYSSSNPVGEWLSSGSAQVAQDEILDCSSISSGDSPPQTPQLHSSGL